MKKNTINYLTSSILYFLKTALTFSLIAAFLIITSCNRRQNIEDAILNNKGSYFYINFDNYPEDKASLPIGIFDSGTGGLAVLNDIVEYESDEYKHVFKNESFIYLADMANMPYGSYALEDNTELLREHIIKNVQFLLSNKYYLTAEATDHMADKSQVKAIVIACNTATAYGFDLIINFIEKAGLDLIVKGVIDAAASGAIKQFSPDENGTVAIMATDGTVRSGAYVSAIEKKKKELNRHGNIHIFQQAGIGIAEAIDQDVDFIDKSAEDYVAFHLVSLMEQIKNTENVQPLKSIILGCTHYPFVEESFIRIIDTLRNYQENGEYVYRKYMAEEITLINPAVKVAKQLHEALEENDLLAHNKYKDSEFYIAVPNVLNNNIQIRDDGSFTYEYKYGRATGNIQEYVKRIPFSRHSINDEILERLSNQVPSVYEMIVFFNNENPKTEYLEPEKRIK